MASRDEWRSGGVERVYARSRGDAWSGAYSTRRPAAHIEDYDLLAGRFEVLRPLGDGSFASVYEAHDLQLDRRVAIKLFTRYERDELDAALHEARAMAKLRHPSVLIVHDIGEHRGVPFLSLEYCETDLRRWLERGPHAAELILAHFVEAGRGLAAAHAAGLVHHDFKPANVLMRSDGSVAVGDFGLAQPLETHDEVQAEQAEREDPAFAFGTLRYIAPERLIGQTGDHRSDQFSFCVALWEALAGEHPFTGGTARARYESILAGPCIVPRVPRAIVRALSRGLSPEPADRFPSLDTLLDLLAKPMPRRRTAAEQGRTLLTAAGLALTFALGLGLAPEGVRTAEADSTMVRVKAADHALELAHDRIFDKDFDAARSAYAKAYRIISAAPLRERREFIPRMQLVAEMFEHAGKGNYAAAIYNDAALTAEAVGIDPAPFIGLRDRAMSAEMRR